MAVADTSSFVTAGTTVSTTTFTVTFSYPASSEINLNDWTCYGFFIDADPREFINDLVLAEKRKDIFRATSIIPKTTEYHQRVIRQNIPAKRNFRGHQSSRL